MIKTKIVKELLQLGGVSTESFGKKGEGWIVRRGYFYTNGYSSDKYAERIAKILNASGLPLFVKEHGDHWAPFRGGDSTAQGSHFYVLIGEDNDNN
jgi:hypothetical protein